MDAHSFLFVLLPFFFWVFPCAAKQVADIQSRLDKGNREHADGQASTASLLAAHERRSSTNIRQLQDSVSNHQRMVRVYLCVLLRWDCSVVVDVAL